MRLKNLILCEFRFLYKYGIVFLYCIFTALYLCIVEIVPISARSITATILVYSDPAAMGLFFMGAVVLLEKSQRVDSSLAVSPVKTSEYIIAKLIPLVGVGLAVSLALCLIAQVKNIVLVILGVVLSSVLFSLCGLIVGVNIKTLNSFIIATIPFEIFLFVPAFLFLFNMLKSKLWIIHPGIAAIQLIQGDTTIWVWSVLSIVLWIVPAYFICKRLVAKSLSTMGGIKL